MIYMQTLMLNVSTKEKADALKKFLSELSFASDIKLVKDKESLREALTEHESVKAAIVKRKNKAIAKYL